jgi:hypothetical protein
MNFSKQRRFIKEGKEMDMVNYLSRLVFDPTKIRNADQYLSSSEYEKTGLFKIYRKINRWYYHGLGNGSNIIDFGMLYHRYTLADFLQKIDTDFSFHQPVVCPSNQLEQEYKITILDDLSIRSFTLLKYLEEGKIPFDITGEFCWEIRNPYFKAGSFPKDVNTIVNGVKEVIVFEGFIDFLFFMAIHQNKPRTATNFLVLNSVSFFDKAWPFMEQHEVVGLYLDNDSTGQKFSQYPSSLNSTYKDESNLYCNYKDTSDWLMDSGNKQTK